MSRVANPFKGTNKVCAQCIKTCKQFENVILVQCPKFNPRPQKRGNPVGVRKSLRANSTGDSEP
jgi:hypothetical protein